LQVRARAINKEFADWLKDCHEKHDKELSLTGFIREGMFVTSPSKREEVCACT
jgi:hypothetical protein